MSQYERRLDLLNKNRVIYRRKPITDKPSESYETNESTPYDCHESHGSYDMHN